MHGPMAARGRRWGCHTHLYSPVNRTTIPLQSITFLLAAVVRASTEHDTPMQPTKRNVKSCATAVQQAMHTPPRYLNTVAPTKMANALCHDKDDAHVSTTSPVSVLAGGSVRLGGLSHLVAKPRHEVVDTHGDRRNDAVQTHDAKGSVKRLLVRCGCGVGAGWVGVCAECDQNYPGSVG